MSSTQFQNLIQTPPPHLIAIVDQFYPLETLIALARYNVNWLEFRADLFEGSFSQVLAYLSQIKQATGFGILGTLRETPANKANRFKQFEQMLPLVDAVDIEVDLDSCSALTTLANQYPVPILLSLHDYVQTPDASTLINWIQKMESYTPAALKFACMAHRLSDISTLLVTLQTKATRPWVGISMGPIGTSSRVIAPIFGSILSYGFISGSVAPGQLSVVELNEQMTRLFIKPDPVGYDD